MKMIVDFDENDITDILIEVYNSWISDVVLNYNSDYYY
jgi:hypothetical protein